MALLLRWCGTLGGTWACLLATGAVLGAPGEPGCRELGDPGAEGLFLLVSAVLAELSSEAPVWEHLAAGI